MKDQLSEMCLVMGELTGLYYKNVLLELTLTSFSVIKDFLVISDKLAAILLEIKEDAKRESQKLGIQVLVPIQKEPIWTTLHNIPFLIHRIEKAMDDGNGSRWQELFEELGEHIGKISALYGAGFSVKVAVDAFPSCSSQTFLARLNFGGPFLLKKRKFCSKIYWICKKK